MKYLFMCYSKWGTCRKARNWLNENNIDYEERDIKEDNPNEEELKEWIGKSGLPIKRFFNTSGNVYRELGLKDKLINMTEDEQIALLSTNGMLVKRPIIIGESQVMVGFKEIDWETIER